METVEGGGIVVILLRSLTSLKQLYTMSMDIHERYRTEAHADVVGRFNERSVLSWRCVCSFAFLNEGCFTHRFLLSLAACSRCLVVDDQLNVLPISSHTLQVKPVGKVEESEDDKELVELKKSLSDTQPVSALLNCCKTLDQVRIHDLEFLKPNSEINFYLFLY